MNHLEITYTVITILVLLLAWAGRALCQPRTEDINNATKPYREWLAYYINRSTPKCARNNRYLALGWFDLPTNEPEAITKLMEEINKNWETDIKTKDETIKSLKSQLRSEEEEALEAQKKLSTLDKELREYNHTSIELLMAEKAQRESIDEIERAEKAMAPSPPKKSRTIIETSCFSWVDCNEPTNWQINYRGNVEVLGCDGRFHEL